jgi:hypothetical protein
VNSSSKSFVDIVALRKLAYTDEDRKAAEQKVAPKAVTNLPEYPIFDNSRTSCKTVGVNLLENSSTILLQNKRFDLLQNRMYNPQVNPQKNLKSESEADSDSEIALKTLKQEEPKDLISVQESVMQDFDDPVEHLYTPALTKSILAQAKAVGCPVSTKVPSAIIKEEASWVQDSSLVSHGGSAAEPPEVAPAPLKEIRDTVYLCSLWWATHPEPKVGNSNSLRKLNPEQRREMFLRYLSDEGDKFPMKDGEHDFAIHLPDPDPDPDKEDEDVRLQDEEIMLSLYREHGRATIEEVIRWLPCSDHWFARLDSLAKFKSAWKLVSDQFDKYLDHAMESDTDESCQEWIKDKFAQADGEDARLIVHERMHFALPIDPQDAAEEQAMDAYDDEYGVAIFNPWAEDDYEAAIAALTAKQAGLEYDEAALRCADWDGYDNIPPYEGVESSSTAPGDTTTTPPRLEVTEWTL